MRPSSNPKISVVICTYKRADYLRLTLLSLEQQTISPSDYELIVVNDGSPDDTENVVQSFNSSLPIRYVYHDNAGLAASKNVGIRAAIAPIIIFLDDDDTASPDFLEQHLGAHRIYDKENYAVLGYTDLDDAISISPLMKYITNEGGFLFSYSSLKHGDVLGYSHFWGGRTSCKLSFLEKHGVFDPEFRFGCEDIELGYRLSSYGLKVIYYKDARSTMMRLLTIDEFFNRLLRQGESQYKFSQMHKEQEIQHWSEVIGAEQTWEAIEPVYESLLNSARNLDSLVNSRIDESLDIDHYTINLLHRAYWNSFRACKIKGICTMSNLKQS